MLKILSAFCLFLAVSSVQRAAAAEVTFVLEDISVRNAGGYGPAWNEQKNPLRVHVGDDLLFTNHDSTGHVIHTNGAPFPHGDRKNPIQPGTTMRIHVEKPYDSLRDGPLYDHRTGVDGGQLFWIVAE